MRKGGRGRGHREKQRTFRAYLHVAASMTGNLGKFSREPAADGGGIKTKRGSNVREKREGRKKRGRAGGGGGWTLRGMCTDYLTRLEWGLRAQQQMGFQIPIIGEGWDRMWGPAGGRGRVGTRGGSHPVYRV